MTQPDEEFDDYLIQEARFLGCNTDTVDCDNPRLTLVARIALAISAKLLAEVRRLRRSLHDAEVRRDEWEKMYDQVVATTEVKRLAAASGTGARRLTEPKEA